MADLAVASEGGSPEAAAVDAAELLFRAKKGRVARPYIEPDSVEAARAAVDRLGELFADLPGSISDALDAAGSSADLLSGDRLQGLSEIVQNADDVEATQVVFLLRRHELLVAHNGTPVELRNVLALATPWLTTKTDESRSSGRFGIGLMTLRSLSRTLEVHCAPYHVRLGDPTVTAIGPFVAPEGFGGPGWTVLRIPIEEGVLSSDDLTAWLTRWDDSALLFLRHVALIVRLTPKLDVAQQLSLRWDGEQAKTGEIGESQVGVIRRHAHSTDGRSWIVYSVDAPIPMGVSRTRKATDATTPIAVGLPLQPAENGVLYAGLPLTRTRLAMWANAQFDPLASRQGLANTAWKAALLPLVADLWALAMLDFFRTNPRAAWPAVPLASQRDQTAAPTPVDALEDLLLDRARHEVASHLSFDVPDIGAVLVSQLAVEVSRLARVLEPIQIAVLADLPATLPTTARDRASQWRHVLDDWRESGASLPDPVEVADALGLLSDDGLDAETTIALAAAAIESDLADELLGLSCVVTDDGRHLAPPGPGAEVVLVAEPGPLAEQLGIALRLHAEHLKHSHDARSVLAWLRDHGALLDATDSAAVIRRLAAAGNAGRSLAEPLTDAQARALRDAFELLPATERSALGVDVGRAILLQGYTYDRRGRKTPIVTSPVAAYLPKSVEKEPDGFAEAAAGTPGLVWLQGRYAEVLRSPAGRSGLGALRFLRLLGAETAPRLRPHPDQEHRYADRRLGVPAGTPGGPKARQTALGILGATYTLEDYDCPDLQAVIANITREGGVRRRRRRALSLLSTLGRSWDRLGELAEVTSAEDYNQWNSRGLVRSFWLWQAGDAAWLNDTDSVPRRPLDLRLRTPATIALYGADVPGYLRPDFDASNRRVVLAALGVTGEPTTAELIDRLRDLRDSPAANSDDELNIHTETAVVYQALAERVTGSARGAGQMTPERIRTVFARNPGLIRTRLGWRTPANTLSGPPIFDDRRAFVPAVPHTEALWRALRVPEPSAGDCVTVLGEMARQRKAPTGTDAAIMLETLLLLAVKLTTAVSDPSLLRRLSRLPLWTSRGWTSGRPVYAVDDPSLAHGLRDHVPVWEPGGGLEQFRALVGPLRIAELRSKDTQVVEPDVATDDPESTDLLRATVRLLRDDLSRNDQAAAASLSIGWEALERFVVRVHPNLRVRIEGDAPTGVPDGIEMTAKADGTLSVLFVDGAEVVPRVDGGGRAIAGLFGADHRLVAHAWRVAWDEAESGKRAEELVLAEQRSTVLEAQTAAEIEARTAAFRDQVGTRRNDRSGRASAVPGRPGGPSDGTAASESAGSATTPRKLVDPRTLQLRNPEGRVVGVIGAKAVEDRGASGAKRRRSPVPPKRGGAPPRGHTGAAGYTALSKESVGLDLVREVLGSDAADVADLRAQRGVGADAIDELDQFYELKVSAGAEPDRVTLTDSEVQRALTEPDFFLVVVSGVEGPNATPKVRVIVDPLHQLQATDDGSITLTGVHNAHSVVFEFEQADPARPAD